MNEDDRLNRDIEHGLNFADGARTSRQLLATSLLPDRQFFPGTLRQGALFLLICWNSQIFSASVANPLGIKGVQEILYVFLLMFATGYLMRQAACRAVIKNDFIVYFIVVCPFIYSSVASFATFSQPIVYGLIEERRILAFLIYFPVVWAIRKAVISVDQVFVWVYWAAVACALLSILVYLNVIQRSVTWILPPAPCAKTVMESESATSP